MKFENTLHYRVVSQDARGVCRLSMLIPPGPSEGHRFKFINSKGGWWARSLWSSGLGTGTCTTVQQLAIPQPNWPGSKPSQCKKKIYISQIETTWHYDPSKNTFAAFSSRSLKCLLVNSIIYSFLSSLFKFSICLFIHSFIHSSHLFICIASFLSIFILSIHLLPSFIYLCISLPIRRIICLLNPIIFLFLRLLLFNLLLPLNIIIFVLIQFRVSFRCTQYVT